MPRDQQDTDRVVIPVLAEEARIEKRVIPRGGVRVHKTVEEVTEHVDVPLTRDDVDVERRPVNRVFDERPEAHVEGNVTIIPVVEEIVQRRFLVREEVRLTRKRTEGRGVADIQLKKEHATVTPIALGAAPAATAIDVLGSEEAADVTTRPRVIEDVVLERTHTEKTVPFRTALKKTEIRVSEAGRNDMYQNQEPSSAHSARKVAIASDRTSAAHGTAARARSFPTGVLLLLVVLAIALIALIAAIF